MKKNFLSDSIIKTISYFDIFEYPLTREELFRFLWQPQPSLSYEDFVFALDTLSHNELIGKVQTKGSYYFLFGKEGLISKREKKIFYLEKKIKIAKRAAKKLRYIPFVKAFFVCNQLQVGVKYSSDIDVFIIAQQGRVWFVRFFTTLLLTLFGLRPTNLGLNFFFLPKEKSMIDKICLSFYVTQDSLDLSKICIGSPDIYQMYWNALLLPIYERENCFLKFQEKNLWAKECLPHTFVPLELSKKWKISDTFLSQFVQKIFEWVLGGTIGDFLDQWVKFIQLQKIKLQNKQFCLKENAKIITNDTMLKFHENDRKKYFQEEWKKKWSTFIV